MERLTSAELKPILRTEVAWSEGDSHQAHAYPILDDERATYAVNGIMYKLRKDHAWVIVQARLVDDIIVIDEDNVFGKHLVDRLTRAGVPREQIILAYLGETLPNTETASP